MIATAAQIEKVFTIGELQKDIFSLSLYLSDPIDTFQEDQRDWVRFSSFLNAILFSKSWRNTSNTDPFTYVKKTTVKKRPPDTQFIISPHILRKWIVEKGINHSWSILTIVEVSV